MSNVICQHANIGPKSAHVFSCFILNNNGPPSAHGDRVLHQVECLGALRLNFEYDVGPIIEIGGPIFLYKLQILEGSTSFREGFVLYPGQ